MKKVPLLGDIEQSIDSSIKDMMGPLGVMYPALKYAVILSNPATALGYAAYRSIPYLASALTSQKAINAYKAVGKSIGKGMLKLGTAGLKIGAKYSKEAVLGLSALTLKQSKKIANHIKNNGYGFDSIKDKINDYILDWDSNEYEETPSLDEKTLMTEQYIDQKAKANARAIAFLTGNRDREALYENQKIAIRKRVEKEGFEYKISTENQNINKNLSVEDEIENNSKSNSVTNEIQEPETIEFSNPMSEKEFLNKPRFIKNVRVGDNCCAIFHKTSTGYTQQFRFGDNLGAVKNITEEEYLKFVQDAEALGSKEKDKSKEREFEFS